MSSLMFWLKLLLVLIFIAERYVVISQLSYGELVSLKVVDVAGRVLQSGDIVQPQSKVSLQCSYLHNDNNTVETIVLSDTPIGKVNNWNSRNLVTCRNRPPTQPHLLSFQRRDLVESSACTPGSLTATVRALSRSAFRYQCQFSSQSISEESIVTLGTNVRNILTLYAVNHRGNHIYSGETDVQAKTFLEIRCAYHVEQSPPVAMTLLGTSLRKVKSDNNLLVTCQANDNTPVLTDNAKNFVATQCNPGSIRGRMRVPNIAQLHYSCRVQLPDGTSIVEHMSFRPRGVGGRRMDCFATRSDGQEIQPGTYVKPGTSITVRCLYIPDNSDSETIVARLNSIISSGAQSYLLGCGHTSGEEGAKIVRGNLFNSKVCVLGTIGGTMQMPDTRKFIIKASATSSSQPDQNGELVLLGQAEKIIQIYAVDTRRPAIHSGSYVESNQLLDIVCIGNSNNSPTFQLYDTQPGSARPPQPRLLTTCSPNARPSYVEHVKNVVQNSLCQSYRHQITIWMPNMPKVQYHCRGYDQLTKLSLNTFIKPYNITISKSKPEGGIKESDEFVYMCAATARPPPKLKLIFEDFLLTTTQAEHSPDSESQLRQTTIIWKSVALKSMHRKMLSCHIDSHVSSSSPSANTILNVHYGPEGNRSEKVHWIMRSEPQLTLQCEFDSYGSLEYTWYELSNFSTILARTQSITLHNTMYSQVKTAVVAEFHCIGVNIDNNNKEATLKITVFQTQDDVPFEIEWRYRTFILVLVFVTFGVVLNCIILLTCFLARRMKKAKRRARKNRESNIMWVHQAQSRFMGPAYQSKANTHIFRKNTDTSHHYIANS